MDATEREKCSTQVIITIAKPTRLDRNRVFHDNLIDNCGSNPDSLFTKVGEDKQNACWMCSNYGPVTKSFSLRTSVDPLLQYHPSYPATLQGLSSHSKAYHSATESSSIGV